MLLDDRELPQEVLKALGGMVADIPDDAILTAGHADPRIFRGYRVKQSNLSRFREIIEQRIHSEKHLAPELRILLQQVPLHEGVVRLLAEAVLSANIDDLTLAFGREKFLAALLISDDEITRKLAWDYIDCHGDASAEHDQTKALQSVRQMLQPLLEQSRVLFPEAVPKEKITKSPDETSRAALDEAKRQLDGTRERLRKEQTEHIAAIARYKAEEEKLKEQIRQLRSQLKQADSVSESLRTELASLNAALDSRAAEMANQAIAATIRPWLANALTTESYRDRLSSDLLTVTRDLLAKQQERDRHFGNRVELLRQRNDLADLLAEVEKAGKSALSPLPDLAVAGERIRGEITRLDSLLGNNAETPPLLAPFLIAINNCDSLDRIAAIRSLIDRGVMAGIYASSSVGECYRALHQKSVQILDFASQQHHRRLPSPVELFLMQLETTDSPKLLIIDGHNVLFLLKEDVFRKYLDQNGIPGSAARNALIETLAGIAELDGSLEIRLYFDGEEPLQYALNDSFRIVYSGGTGAHRADNAILTDLAFYAQKGDRSISIITRDMDLASQAANHGALRIDPVELSGLIAANVSNSLTQ